MIVEMVVWAFFMGRSNDLFTLSSLRFSRGWVREDGNLVMETGCRPPYEWCGDLHSAKGGAVETGCSELYDVIHYFTI